MNRWNVTQDKVQDVAYAVRQRAINGWRACAQQPIQARQGRGDEGARLLFRPRLPFLPSRVRPGEDDDTRRKAGAVGARLLGVRAAGMGSGALEDDRMNRRHAITPTDRGDDWRRTNPGYVPSPTRLGTVNGRTCVEVDGGDWSDRMREYEAMVKRAKPWTAAELAGRR
jgi:hypothetical protein